MCCIFLSITNCGPVISKQKVVKLLIPNKVKIAGINYIIEQKEVVIIEGGTNYAGACDPKNARIEILEDMPIERKEETFVHELFHAILFESGFSVHDEELVDRSSRILYQVLKDNDLFFK